jgi:hypothetical protein
MICIEKVTAKLSQVAGVGAGLQEKHNINQLDQTKQ